MNIGIFGNDPGGATGLAWGVFDPGAASLEDALAGRMLAGSTTVEGTAHEQIREITAIWQSFYRSCVKDACLPPERIYYVCEDFIYSGNVNYGGESAEISTALIWGVEGYRMGQADEFRRLRRGKPIHVPPVILQTAGQAKGAINSQRLKEYGCWVVGRDHERSAWQHVAYFLKRYMIQHT